MLFCHAFMDLFAFCGLIIVLLTHFRARKMFSWHPSVKWMMTARTSLSTKGFRLREDPALWYGDKHRVLKPIECLARIHVEFFYKWPFQGLIWLGNHHFQPWMCLWNLLPLSEMCQVVPSLENFGCRTTICISGTWFLVFNTQFFVWFLYCFYLWGSSPQVNNSL